MSKQNFNFLFTIFLVFLFFSCDLDFFLQGEEPAKNGTRISVASWNVQTFFDAITDGNEYSEFIGSSSKWSEEKYKVRIVRLCEMIALLDCDIVVFEEVEKETLAYDIANNLDFQTDRDKAYSYSCFAKEENSSIGNMVLSRYPIEKVKVHQLAVQNFSADEQPEMRPILEVNVLEDATEEDSSAKEITNRIFTLLVCHWKSKSGGAEETEIWRNYQEELLADIISNIEDEKFLVCGDFNRELNEFLINDNEAGEDNEEIANLQLRGRSGVFPVYSPWIEATNSEYYSGAKGSYYYDNDWERIDHFFAGKDLSLIDFSAVDSGPHVTTEGIPFRYSVFSGEGYSDHLPIKCCISLN